MSATLSYFRWAFIVTALGLVAAFWLGWSYNHNLGGALSFFVIGLVLAVLEISLSFDNAIVNANKLKDMTPEWQRRFLTWGILIAVFGMRIIFPLLIVVIAAKIGPFEALHLAVARPDEYARLIGGAHLTIAAFGGTFLMMVALRYFIDEGKEVDWIRTLECQLRRCASVRGLEIGFVLSVVLLFAAVLPEHEVASFLFASVGGLLTFLAVEVVGQFLDRGAKLGMAARGGLGAFLYLEVLDASFSFDGVIGAFALTHNLFLIAIGLGIGAMYVRSMTIMLVEKQTLAEFRYLEHGAFYSILVLSVIMFAQTLWSIHELVTGLLGAGFIGLALISSIRHNRRENAA
ncbi:DUF475 domain-containing protein [Albidovulum sediminicola]|uniref:DUF475 domain-containing protein n=1 Tax=Albidovulum sediminicola TaxID=2984331 RepID=A0ABT2Z6Y1_9RHOB|nr:DUF475 domain-containing protein [Defluviimonas sp. WL0075]MCV2866536.1 DUF475 domain-containing protein [Defluviimonas sp. WL0075]